MSSAFNGASIKTRTELLAALRESIPTVLAARPATRDEILAELGILGTHAGFEARAAFDALERAGVIEEACRPGELSVWKLASE